MIKLTTLYTATALALAALLGLAVMSSPAAAKGDADFPTVVTTVSGVAHLNDGCTTWYIGNDLWVTASHCVENITGNNIVLDDGTALKANVQYLASVFSGAEDFAVLKTKTGSVTKLDISCGMPVIGQDVFMTGFPGDFGKMTHFGKVASLPRKVGPWPKAYWTDMSALGGYSGSAVQSVFDGKVIGILVGVAGLPGVPSSMSITIPTDKLCKVLYE